VPERSLARGPGSLGQALALTREDNGADLLGGGAFTLRPPTGPPRPISSGPRVGVSRASGWPWRYWATGDPTVSAYRRSKRAVGSG
jgi:DNA-3-methyladenine glycosylase